MKRDLFLSVIMMLLTGLSWAQSGKAPAKNPTTKPAPSPLKTANDSASYAIGINVASFYKQLGIKKINASLLSRAINEVYANKPTLMDGSTANIVMTVYMNKLEEEKAKPNMMAGEKFLAQNKLRPGVKTTASGLQYEVLREAEGPKPLANDSVTCNYLGTFLNGTEFDNSYKRGASITFSLDKVIRGWTEGLQLMSVGSKYKFYIPYTLGWGAADYNMPGGIPGGSMVIFEVELLDIRKPIGKSTPYPNNQIQNQ